MCQSAENGRAMSLLRRSSQREGNSTANNVGMSLPTGGLKIASRCSQRLCLVAVRFVRAGAIIPRFVHRLPRRVAHRAVARPHGSRHQQTRTCWQRPPDARLVAVIRAFRLNRSRCRAHARRSITVEVVRNHNTCRHTLPSVHAPRLGIVVVEPETQRSCNQFRTSHPGRLIARVRPSLEIPVVSAGRASAVPVR